MDLLCFFIGISIAQTLSIMLRPNLSIARNEKNILFNKNNLVLTLFILCREAKVSQETGLVFVSFLGEGFDCVEGLERCISQSFTELFCLFEYSNVDMSGKSHLTACSLPSCTVMVATKWMGSDDIFDMIVFETSGYLTRVPRLF